MTRFAPSCVRREVCSRDARSRSRDAGSTSRRQSPEEEATLSRFLLARRIGVAVAAAALLASPGIARAQGGQLSPQQKATTLASPAVVFINTTVSGRIRLEFFDVFSGKPRAFNTTFTFPYASV